MPSPPRWGLHAPGRLPMKLTRAFEGEVLQLTPLPCSHPHEGCSALEDDHQRLQGRLPPVPDDPETADHLIFGRPFVRALWRVWEGGGSNASSTSVCNLHLFDVSSAVGDASPVAFVLLSCWHLWKRRNVIVFRACAASLPNVLKCCRDDARLWHGRMPIDQHEHVDIWLHVLGAPPARGVG